MSSVLINPRVFQITETKDNNYDAEELGLLFKIIFDFNVYF